MVSTTQRHHAWHHALLQVAIQAEFNHRAIQLSFLVACCYTAVGLLRLGWITKWVVEHCLWPHLGLVQLGSMLAVRAWWLGAGHATRGLHDMYRLMRAGSPLPAATCWLACSCPAASCLTLW